MSNVGSGTISSLRDAIVYIANSEPLKDLGLKEELEKNKKRFTDRVIENFSYLLHIEISSKNKWCIAKPSINILPGLQNRAIIVGSRNDYLLDRLFKNIQASDTYSVSCIDNSKLFQHIKLLKSASGSSESINISLDDNSKYHTYEVFSPTTIMVSDFENIMDLKDLCRDLEVKSVNLTFIFLYKFTSFN